MLDAIGQIRLELEQESRARNRRSLVLFFLLAAVAISMPLLSGVNAALHPQSALAFAIAAGFVLLGVSASSSQQLRIGPNSAAAIAAVAFLSPLIAATSIGSHPTGLSCFVAIAGLGFLAVAGARLILGRTRRRFGGASTLQSVACAMAPALAVGLECPAADALHLLIHAGAAVLVGVGLAKLLLR